MNKKTKCRDYILSILILLLAFIIGLLIHEIFHAESMIPLLFGLAVFFISICTNGYRCGIAACLISVLAVNYAFTFPYFAFNFTIQENLISAIIMFLVVIFTSTLGAELRKQEKIKAEMEKERMHANLLRAISHDLRTPLTTIYGASSAIIENYSEITPDTQRRLLEGIRENAEWLIRMVENLLSVTRIDKDNVQIVKTPVVVEELIDSALVKFKKRYPGNCVEVYLEEEFVTIPMDAVLVQQVLLNLLENAVQHAHGMTKIQISLHKIDGEEVFEVSDDGCGIPKERFAHIFRGNLDAGDIAVDSRKKNLGIGLSVCMTIVKAHGGWMKVQNRKNGGACFRFSLGKTQEK